MLTMTFASKLIIVATFVSTSWAQYGGIGGGFDSFIPARPSYGQQVNSNPNPLTQVTNKFRETSDDFSKMLVGAYQQGVQMNPLASGPSGYGMEDLSNYGKKIHMNAMNWARLPQYEPSYAPVPGYLTRPVNRPSTSDLGYDEPNVPIKPIKPIKPISYPVTSRPLRPVKPNIVPSVDSGYGDSGSLPSVQPIRPIKPIQPIQPIKPVQPILPVEDSSYGSSDQTKIPVPPSPPVEPIDGYGSYNQGGYGSVTGAQGSSGY